MTPELRVRVAVIVGRWLFSDTSTLECADALAPIFAEVEAAAVERCAKVAEDDSNTWGVVKMPQGGGVTLLAEPRTIAVAIRAQNEEKP